MWTLKVDLAEFGRHPTDPNPLATGLQRTPTW